MGIRIFFYKIKWVLLLILIFIGIGIPIFFGEGFINFQKDQEVLFSEQYPLIENMEDEVKGRVLNKKVTPYFVGAYMYELSNGYKFLISNQTKNMEYKKSNSVLMEMLSVGDSIFKPQKTDSIYVYQNTQRYYFIVGKKIN